MAAAIDPALIRALGKALGLRRRAVYDRIQKVVYQYHLDRRPAAILLASQNQVNTSRFAMDQDRAAIREAVYGGGGSGRGLGTGVGRALLGRGLGLAWLRVPVG